MTQQPLNLNTVKFLIHQFFLFPAVILAVLLTAIKEPSIADPSQISTVEALPTGR